MGIGVVVNLGSVRQQFKKLKCFKILFSLQNYKQINNVCIATLKTKYLRKHIDSIPFRGGHTPLCPSKATLLLSIQLVHSKQCYRSEVVPGELSCASEMR